MCGVLQQRGVCVDSVSSAGDTALQCAIKHGCLLSAVMLIQALSRQQFTRVLPSLRHLQVTACLPCVYSSLIQTRQRSHRSHSWISAKAAAAGSEGQGKEGWKGTKERERGGGGFIPLLPVPGSTTVKPHRQHAVLDACCLLIHVSHFHTAWAKKVRPQTRGHNFVKS